MRTLPIFFFNVLLLLGSCKMKESSHEATSDDTAQAVMHTKHTIAYDSEIKLGQTKLRIDSSLTYINCSDTIISFRINPVTSEVLRVCASKGDARTTYLLLNGNKIMWDSTFGSPNEFTNRYLFSDVYHGDEDGGTITKFKFNIKGNQLQLLDSIPGGSYSEGAGSWEWLISNSGDHKAIIFEGGDAWEYKDDMLLITHDGSSRTFLIDLQKNDTVLNLADPDGLKYNRMMVKNGVLFATGIRPEIGYLWLYNLHGQLQWKAESDYLEKIMVDDDDNLIIASGYYFPEGDNTESYFTVAYDKNSGQMKWNFPTAKACNAQVPTIDVHVSNIFKITHHLYGMVVYSEEVVNRVDKSALTYGNKLIVFDSDGKIYETFNLSVNDQRCRVTTKKVGEFEIVSNDKTWKFKVYAP